MNPVTDQELVLYHYRDGLDPGRSAEVEEALFYDAGLRLRLAALRELLGTAAAEWPVPEPDAGLEQRVWSRLEPALPTRVVARRTLATRLAAWFALPRLVTLAALLAVLGIGFQLGRESAQSAQPLLADDASSRMLSSYLAAHLRDIERALLVARFEPKQGETVHQLASELLVSHRMFALAAERSGRESLARFLREIEPTLIELANHPDGVPPALGEEIGRRDLAFKARAAAVLAQAGTSPSTHSL